MKRIITLRNTEKSDSNNGNYTAERNNNVDDEKIPNEGASTNKSCPVDFNDLQLPIDPNNLTAVRKNNVQSICEENTKFQLGSPCL